MNYCRSKYIAVADKAYLVPGHITGKGLAGSSPALIHEKYAYLHHYRKECVDNSCDSKEKRIVEDSATRFGVQIADRVTDRLYSNAKHCNIMF